MGLGDRPTIRQVEGSTPERFNRWMRGAKGYTPRKAPTYNRSDWVNSSDMRQRFRDYVNRAKSYIAPRSPTRQAGYAARMQSAEDAWGGQDRFQAAVNALGPNLQDYLVAEAPANETTTARQFRLGREQRALDRLGQIAGEDLELADEDIRQRRINTLQTYLRNPINYDI